MVTMIEVAETQGALHGQLSVYRYLANINERLGVQGQSSDEEDMQGAEVTRLLVKECNWRSKEVDGYMRFIDILREKYLVRPGIKVGVPRVRQVSQQKSDGPA